MTLWQKFAITAHSSQLTAHSLSCGLLTGKLRLLALLIAVFLLSFIVPQAQAVTITLHTNGGTITTSNGSETDPKIEETTPGSEYKLTFSDSVTNNYKFPTTTNDNATALEGWYTEAALTNKVEATNSETYIPTDATDGTAYYANWTYTLTLNNVPDNASITAGDSTVTVTDNSATVTYTHKTTEFSLPTLTKEYATFLGWKTGEDATILDEDAIKFPKSDNNANATYTAVFGSYKNGENDAALPDDYELLTATTSEFGKAAYVVYGEVTLNADLALTADNISIILLDGAKLTLTDKSITATGKTLTIYSQSTEGDNVGTLTAQSITAGTLTLAGGKVTIGDKTYTNGKTSYTVTFNAGEGKWETESTKTVEVEVEYGKSATIATKPEDPTRDYYSSVVWQLDNTDFVFATDDNATTLTEAQLMAGVTLTAAWTATDYTITLNLGDNGTLSETGSFTKDGSDEKKYTATFTVESATFTLPTPTPNDGYTFAGWKLEGGSEEAQTTVTINNGEVVADRTYTATYATTSTKTAYTPSENKPEFFKKDDKTIHSLALGGLIGVDFYAYIPETGFEDCSVTFKIGDEEQTVTVSDTVDHAEYTHPDYTDTFHRFTCRITSVQMADEITATLNYTAANAQGANVGDGPEPFTVEGDTDSFSAVKYLDAVLADGSGASANLIALAKAIKDYGYYAQQSLADYHGWTIGDEETNAHKAITKSDDAEITVNDVTANTLSTNKITITRSKAENSSFGEVTYSLLLDDEVEIELNVPYTGQADTVTATIDGTALTNNPVKNADNVYTINTGGIPAHLLGTAKGIVLTAGTGDEAETCTVSVSGYSYVHSVLSQSGDDNKATDGYTLSKLKQAVIALYKYGQAAVTYNTSPNN